MSVFKHLPSSCSFRYEDAVSKYEAVMNTEPHVHYFSVLAKERICHALAQVRPPYCCHAAMRCINSLFGSIKLHIHRTFNQRVFVLCHDQGQQASRAISVCSTVLQSDPENVNALKDRADAYIQDEQYEEGKHVRCSCM